MTEASYKNGKKKDVYHYNFLTHKPKYVYTTDEKRMEKKTKHYDKFANDPAFKKAMGNFYAVESEFPKPDYTKRGPVTNNTQITTSNSSLTQQTEPTEDKSQFTCNLSLMLLLINDFKERCKIVHQAIPAPATILRQGLPSEGDLQASNPVHGWNRRRRSLGWLILYKNGHFEENSPRK